MYWTLELASKLEDAPWPATKEELIDYATRSGAPLEVLENLQEIEGTGVAAYLRRMMQVCLIRSHLFCIYLTKGDVLVVSVSLEAVEGCLVMQRGAVLPVLDQQGDEEVHELK